MWFIMNSSKKEEVMQQTEKDALIYFVMSDVACEYQVDMSPYISQ